ncbi:MAG TPA: type II toxin-antitoxin system VapC family toxin [Polyangiaceae bacterium]|nr:type II toxin-antitoxin system VapC family toxin [Polyangiaceae bacterium]
MIIPDINLLLYANITSFPQHSLIRKWWEDALNGDEQVGLPTVSLFGFVRLASNPRLFTPAMAVDEAVGRIEAWLEQPHVHLLCPGPRHLEIAFDLLRKLGAAQNLTTDVQLAALTLEHQATLCSNDQDFARFPGLRWVNPVAGKGLVKTK